MEDPALTGTQLLGVPFQGALLLRVRMEPWILTEGSFCSEVRRASAPPQIEKIEKRNDFKSRSLSLTKAM